MALFRKLGVAEPLIVELREWSRIDEELKVERLRLANRLRDQLWRYYPQMLELGDLDEDWMLDLWETAPTPEKAFRASKAAIARVLKKHRIRRFDAAQVLSELRKPALSVAQGTIEAATAHIRESWTRFFAQGAKWNFCLTAGKIRPRIRRHHEEESAPEPLPGFQGKSGTRCYQGRSHACSAV